MFYDCSHHLNIIYLLATQRSMSRTTTSFKNTYIIANNDNNIIADKSFISYFFSSLQITEKNLHKFLEHHEKLLLFGHQKNGKSSELNNNNDPFYYFIIITIIIIIKFYSICIFCALFVYKQRESCILLIFCEFCKI